MPKKIGPALVAEQTIRVPEKLPLYMASGLVLFPGLAIPIEIEGSGKGFVDHVLGRGGMFVIATRKPENFDQIYDVGTAVEIEGHTQTTTGAIRLQLRSLRRVRLRALLPPDPFPRVEVEVLPEVQEEGRRTKALVVILHSLLQRYLKLSPPMGRDLLDNLSRVHQGGELADVVATYLPVSLEFRQQLLEKGSARQRLAKLLPVLAEEIKIHELAAEIQKGARGELEKSRREHYLRTQLEVIQRELGEGGEDGDWLTSLPQQISSHPLPEEAAKELAAQVQRLPRINRGSPEFLISQTYIEWLLALPWNTATPNHRSISQVKRLLDQGHFGMEMVKKRILEFLAVRKLKGDQKGPILCFVGPPGTGKTSMGQAIAQALGRRFYRIALGGIRDEAEIRGHRRTYVGAMPGRLIQGLKKVGVNNPLIMLDEIDKLGQNFQGDPAAALLEVLDPEQNNTFVDNYLNVKFDLSPILFIATANQRDTIPLPLLDRMEVIELHGYTAEEKIAIAGRYLLPRQLRANGLTTANLAIHKPALQEIVGRYTWESGLRNLDRRLAAICRQVAYRLSLGEQERVVIKNALDVRGVLGPPKFFSEVAQRTTVPGVATGLAWTPVGGEILFIEVARVAGREKLVLTGKLGEVMKESAQTALTFLKTRVREFGLAAELLENCDVHLHIPAGAIAKDGPSAGITIFLALFSLFSGRLVNKSVAATGEITLQGLVLPVGGVREKVLAARRAGIQTIIMPERNRYDLDTLPSHLREGVRFHLVAHAEEAIEVALAP